MLRIVTSLTVILVCLHVRQVRGHGFLAEPPGRSSMWKYGFATPVNYQHNELFCGGFQHQQSLGGKCGVCGDPWDGDRENEAGGKYATGTIAREYSEGDEIQAEVMITANHKGWFEFRLCPVNDINVKATHECLDQTLLELADGSGTRFHLPTTSNALYIMKYRLPQGLTCSQCVLQWKYHTGNSWGTDPDGTQCIGCGPQEEFYGCADIRIHGSGESPSQGSTTKTPTTQKPDETTAKPCPPSLVIQTSGLTTPDSGCAK